MNLEKILKYLVWTGLIAICFIPLVIIRDYFFPFIVPKTLFFRIIVEVIFLAYLGLAVIKKEYRPKLNLVSLLFGLYLAVVFISSIINDTFVFSFWSSNERSEGLLLLIHLFLFLIVASGFLRKFKDWLIIFEASFLASILLGFVALKQYVDPTWEFFGGMQRLSATIGNAGYVAGYLIFNIFFGLFLFFFRKNKYLHWYYILGILLQIFVVFNTLTRGGIIALFFSLTVFISYLAFVYFKQNKWIKNTSILAVILVIIFVGLVFLSQQADWVRNNRVLGRITDISFEDTTTKNRLMTWQSAWQGFKDKPILGYGYENFYIPFDKYFNPGIYRHAGSVTWFDRAHNIIFDRLITGGLIGLLLYLSLLILPLYYLWRYYKRIKDNNRYLIPVIFSLVIIGYFIQNLFIFEALVTYIPLFLVLAFLSLFTPSWQDKIFQSKNLYVVLLTIGIIVYLPVLFAFNIKPAQVNKGLVEAIIRTNIDGQHQEAYDRFVEVLDKNTSYNQEYRQHFTEFVIRAIALEELDSNWRVQAAMRAEQELEKQIAEKPQSVRNYLMFIRFLNKSYVFNVERLDRAIELIDEAIVLSPTRQALYTEAGYSYYNLGSYYKQQDNMEKAEESFDQSIANMQKAISLSEQVAEGYVNMISVLLFTGRSDQIDFYYDKYKEVNADNYKVEEWLKRLGSGAITAGEHQWAAVFYKDLTDYISSGLISDNPQYWINLAVAYAYMGEYEKAIAAAESIRKYGPEYDEQADLFIENIKEGYFEK